MEVEICSVGGYNEVGKNMTAIRIDDEVILCDMGIFLPPIVDLQQDDQQRQKNMSSPELIKIGAIPDDTVLDEWKDKVKAIVLGHAHLDHIGAVQYLAGKYRAPIIGSPFSLQVLKSILEDDKIDLPNKINPIAMDKKVRITDNIELELISISHSTLQCSIVALHTKDGVVLYATDFKLDNQPVVGNKPNYKRLRELGDSGKVLLCICECLYAPKNNKTPSESVAREMLKDVLLGVDNHDKAVFVTTFASHLPRIRSIIDFGKRLNRRVLVLGRSMNRYIRAAEKLNLVQFTKEVKMVPYRKDVEKILQEVERNRGKYLVLCTGNQGEPGSILDKILSGQLHFNFHEEDHLVFSCKTIPASVNIANREKMEMQFKKKKVRLFTDIHVSGHSGREDLRDFITMIKPMHLIPCHGEPSMEGAFSNLAVEMNYTPGKTIHVMQNGQKLKLDF
ncbi:MAG: RNase J family beta-CASP ribonuclease [Candidatus Nanoarchaeia archaeon]